MPESPSIRPRVLLTGATGYVGGQLLPVLESAGYHVRCLVRREVPALENRFSNREICIGDVLDLASLSRALQGVYAAFYLIHSMGGAADFEQTDRVAAQNFAAAARAAGVRRLIYLGGLGGPEEELSPHLRSRQEVGVLLRASGVQVIEFRASVVLGSGSLSFEMIRALVERLPVMVTPRWVAVTAQPIAIADLLEYLLAALALPEAGSRVYEIGGADRISYGGLMRQYAQQRGLRRWMIPVPVLTPRLSSLWLGLVTPFYTRVGRLLIDSIRHPTVVRNDTAARDFAVRPTGVREAIRAALAAEDRAFDTVPLSTVCRNLGKRVGRLPPEFGHRIVDSASVRINLSPKAAFAAIRRIGGRTGWYFGNGLWRLRGWIDRLVGGPGMSRGRRDEDELRTGDVVDGWRVVAYEPGRRVRFQAEMKLPGRAWLEFEVVVEGAGARIWQTAAFDPHGLLGRAYWYALYPIHRVIFNGMLRAIARAAHLEEEGANVAGRP